MLVNLSKLAEKKQPLNFNDYQHHQLLAMRGHTSFLDKPMFSKAMDVHVCIIPELVEAKNRRFGKQVFFCLGVATWCKMMWYMIYDLCYIYINDIWSYIYMVIYIYIHTYIHTYIYIMVRIWYLIYYMMYIEPPGFPVDFSSKNEATPATAAPAPPVPRWR